MPGMSMSEIKQSIVRKTAAVQQCRARGKQAHGIVGGFQQIFKRPQNALIIIDDGNYEAGSLVSHGSCCKALNVTVPILRSDARS